MCDDFLYVCFCGAFGIFVAIGKALSACVTLMLREVGTHIVPLFYFSDRPIAFTE